MSFELSLLAAFGAMLFWGIGDFLIQRTVRKVGNIEALAFIGIIGAVGLLPFVIKDMSSLASSYNVLILFLLGVIVFLVSVINFEALKKGKLSVIEVVLEIELPVTIILAFIFLRETLSLAQLIVTLFIFLGIVLIATKPESWKKTGIHLEKGVLLSVIAAVGMGFINFFTASSAKQISPLLAIWFPWFVVSCICLAWIVKRAGIRAFAGHWRRFTYLIIAMSVIDTLAWLLYAAAVLKNEVSITIAITESYPAVALFLGVYFNKEKIYWHQYTGAVIALTSSVVLGYLAG